MELIKYVTNPYALGIAILVLMIAGSSRLTFYRSKKKDSSAKAVVWLVMAVFIFGTVHFFVPPQNPIGEEDKVPTKKAETARSAINICNQKNVSSTNGSSIIECKVNVGD